MSEIKLTPEQLQSMIANAIAQGMAAAQPNTITPAAAPQTDEVADEGGQPKWTPEIGEGGEVKIPATKGDEPASNDAPIAVWMPSMVTDGPLKPAAESKVPGAAKVTSMVVGNPKANDLPSTKEIVLHPTSKLPAGARKRWNVKEITGDDQTVFEIRQGDDPTAFTMTGASKALAAEVIVALSLVDRTRRNAMRLALEEGYAKKHAGDPTLELYDKAERGKLQEFLDWLRSYGASGLDAGHRPWDGKVAGTHAGGPPPNVMQLLKAMGVAANASPEVMIAAAVDEANKKSDDNEGSGGGSLN